VISERHPFLLESARLLADLRLNLGDGEVNLLQLSFVDLRPGDALAEDFLDAFGAVLLRILDSFTIALFCHKTVSRWGRLDNIERWV
jgi:hypothetical protein